MQELIIKMAICLLIALALGFLFGWLLKRAFANEKYGTIIETLESDLTKSKDALKMSEEESTLIKEQFINVQNELETSSRKTTELEDRLSDYSAKLSMLKSNVEDRESRIQEEQKQKSLLQTQLDEKHHEFKKVLKESANQNEVINRVKEHHTLLQGELTKLKEVKDSRDKELEKLSIMIDKHKANEVKLLDEKKAKEGKLIELESILNEKKIAAIELKSKVKEMDALKQKNTLLQETLNQTQISLKESEDNTKRYKNSLKNVTPDEIEKRFFDKLEQAAQNRTYEKFNSGTKDDINLIKLAKKALHYVADTNEEINKNADDVIKKYKEKYR